MAELVAGVAEGCRQVGAALIGGEMAEHPGVMKPGEFDLVGFAVGVVEQDEALGPVRVRPGDVLIGLASPGLRCNGYSLARHVLSDRSGLTLTAPAWPGAAVSLADELIRPSVIYTPAVRAAIAATRTAGVPGAPERRERRAERRVSMPSPTSPGAGSRATCPGPCPRACTLSSTGGRWEIPPIFGEIRRLGNVTVDEMARVFNLGLGMVMMVDPSCVDGALEALGGAGVDAMVVGRVEADGSGVAGGSAAGGSAAGGSAAGGSAVPGVTFVGPEFWSASDDPPARLTPRGHRRERPASSHRIRGAPRAPARALGQAG